MQSSSQLHSRDCHERLFWPACRGHADVALLADNANDMFAEEVR